MRAAEETALATRAVTRARNTELGCRHGRRHWWLSRAGHNSGNGSRRRQWLGNSGLRQRLRYGRKKVKWRNGEPPPPGLNKRLMAAEGSLCTKFSLFLANMAQTKYCTCNSKNFRLNINNIRNIIRKIIIYNYN